MATVGVVLAGLTGLAAYLYGPPTQRALTKLGVYRELTSSSLADPADLVVIPDTVQCEDLHYHAPSHTLFTACEDVYDTRFQWFPPLGLFDAPDLAWKAQGSLHTIDPETKESKRLALEDFDGPFITHGIDVLADPEKPTEAVYIFAINHIPNEAVFPRDGASSSSPPPLSKKDTTTTTTTTTSSQEKAASRIEVFHHVLGSSSAQHRRTMAHPLIRTPNDLVATSPTSVYVSNDHYYREGRLRALEDMYPGATWSDVVHATTLAGDEGTATVAATVVLDRLWNPNGVGRGRTEDEIVIASAVGGYLNVYGHLLPRTQEEDKKSGGGGGGDDVRNIVLNETIDLDSTIDNPTWFADPYAIDDKSDASGFVLGGLARAVDLSKTGHDPQGREGVLVWHVTPRKGKDGGGGGGGGWDKKLLWQDDGRMIRNTATAVLVAIDPAREQGAKKAWLFVTGFSSANAVAVKVDL